MRLANLDGRAVLLIDEANGLDVEAASEGRFGPELAPIYDDWSAFASWAADATTSSSSSATATVPIDEARLGAPSPAPRQIFAIGLNYADHAAESRFEAPDGLPPVFTKYVSSLTGPVTTVTLPTGGKTDWEVELVAVIGATAHDLDDGAGWDAVAGVMVGQDISERLVQLRGPAPQFGLGKSFPGFSPTGPWLTTPDELADRDDLEIWATIDDESVQQGRTSQLIYPVARLVEELSRIVTLLPGDLIFTGTPAGVGSARTPRRFLRDGEVLRSGIEGLGTLRQTFVDA